MPSPSTPNKDASSFAVAPAPDRNAADLKFISELGRSLLFAVHPKKVASRVAEALHSRLDVVVCGFSAELDSLGLISAACPTEHGGENGAFDKQRLEKWLSFMPPQVGYLEKDPAEFLLAGDGHKAEYVSPLQIKGAVHGAIVVGLASEADLTEADGRLIEATTQLAAMSVNLTAHYEAAMGESVHEAREEHRKFTEAVLDALPVSLYVVDRDYSIVTWNKQREIGQLGIPRETAVGRNVFDVLDKYPQGRVREEFERAFRTGRIERIEQQTVAEDGSTRHWLVSKVPMRDEITNDISHVITIGEDVTVRVEAIHAMNRAEKLAAVGRLAAGIVHEINNPLATIAACAESLEQRVEEGSFAGSDAIEDLADYLGLIKSEAFRCKTITTDLLDFSRVRAGERTPADVGDIVRSAANLISHQKRGKNIVQELEIEPDLPSVLADPGQIQQAIIALATNAIDAMPEGGTLTFRAAYRGNRVLLEVADTGHGIPQDDVSKIFEPFFTTKEVGKGTGLGLAVCYGIITEHSGRISVRSNVGKGTTFSIFLPVCTE
ncbi:MAG TPA: ATP-binding protein [Pyrinomonadaceae bacterium]|nr:ATP-binding protein [Pyrinomonadaceae bacterium]